MLIQCTKALLEKMNINKNELTSLGGHDHFPDSLKTWQANLVNIERRKAVILMNNETRYSVVIYRPKPKDFKRIKELIGEAIKVALHVEGISDDVINRYMEDAGEIEFSKTANRSMVAKLNSAVNEVCFFQEYLDESTSIQKYISLTVRRRIHKLSETEWFYPIDKLIECFNTLYCKDRQDVLDVDQYQLKIRIDIEGFDIWRRVLVPSTYSFRHLHNIIQTVFDWQNYHLHVFEVIKGGLMVKKIVVDDDPETLEWLDFDTFEVLQERFVALEDIFPEYGEVSYEYDFGDSWDHTITLEKVVKSNKFEAAYLGGTGERPPEDVGGSGGYEEYIRIMADDKDPEYENMKAWTESQKERKITKEKINDRLRNCICGFGYSRR